MADNSKRPLFQRLSRGVGAVNMASSVGGKRTSTGDGNQNAFTGELALNNPLGTFWNAFVQAGVLNLVVGADAEIGGFDRVQFTSDGSAVNLDGAYTWLPKWGAIDTTPGARNILTAQMVDANTIEYSVLN